MTSFRETCCEEEEVHRVMLPPRCILEQLGQGFMLMAKFLRDAFPGRISGSAQNLWTSRDSAIPVTYI